MLLSENFRTTFSQIHGRGDVDRGVAILDGDLRHGPVGRCLTFDRDVLRFELHGCRSRANPSSSYIVCRPSMMASFPNVPIDLNSLSSFIDPEKSSTTMMSRG